VAARVSGCGVCTVCRTACHTLPGTQYTVYLGAIVGYFNVNFNILYVEIKCQLDAKDEFLLQILRLAQHVSGTIMPIIRSSRVLYKGVLSVVFGAVKMEKVNLLDLPSLSFRY
jgi:hypothetical protein